MTAHLKVRIAQALGCALALSIIFIALAEGGLILDTDIRYITKDECFERNGTLVEEPNTTPNSQNSIWYCEHPNGTKTWVPGDYELDDQHEPPEDPHGLELP